MLVRLLVGRDEGVVVLRREDELEVRLRLDLGLQGVAADPVLGQGDVPALRVGRLLPRRPVAGDVDEAALEGNRRLWRWRGLGCRSGWSCNKELQLIFRWKQS